MSSDRSSASDSAPLATSVVDSLDPALVDFLDPAVFEQGVPHDAYRVLRATAPVSWRRSAFAGPNDRGYWLFTRHADVQQALSDPTNYSSAQGATSLLEMPPQQLELARTRLINMDPPNHTRFRRLISRSFAPRVVEQLEPEVRRMCRVIVDEVASQDHCEVVSQLASRLPAQVIFALLGVPASHWDRLVGLSNELVEKAGDPAAIAAVQQIYLYGQELAQERRSRPGDDLVSQLLTAEVEGELLSPIEFSGFFLVLVVAGNETTRNLISGGLLALLSHPEQLARLRGEPALMNSAVEEMLRFVSPVNQFRRTASRDIELRGQHIAAGDRVILAHSSANRDESVFSDPDTFDIGRHPNPHVAFGAGPHFCIGAALARLEARCMFDEILTRLDDLTLAGPITRTRSNLVNAWKSIPLRFRAR